MVTCKPAFSRQVNTLAALLLGLCAVPVSAELFTWQGDILVAHPYEWANTVWGEPGNWDLGRVPTVTDSAVIQGGKTVVVTFGTMPWGTFVNDGTVGAINMLGDATGVPTLEVRSFSTLDVSAGYISSLTLVGHLTGGTFAGGVLSIGRLNWASGCCGNWDPYLGGYVRGGMGGLGTTTVLNNLGGGNLYGNRVLELVGTATSGGFTLYDNARVVNSGYMTSPGGAVNNGGNWGGGGAYNPDRRFDNVGTLLFEPNEVPPPDAPPGGLRHTLEFSTFFNNSGTVEVRQGTASVAVLQVLNSGTHSGRFEAGAGTELRFERGHTFTAGSAIDSSGKVTFAGFSYTVGGSYRAAITEVSNADVTFAGSVGTMGDLTLAGASLTFNTGAAVSVGTLVLNGGGIGGTDTINIAGPLTWNGGWVNGSPVNANGGILVNAGNHAIHGTLNNLGVADWNGNTDVFGTLNNAGTVNWTGGNFSLTGTINNLKSALFDVRADNNILGTGGTFNNLGTFRKSGGAGITLIEGAFNNAGMVDVLSGTLRLFGGGTHSGGSFTAQPGAYILVQGTHTITGNVTTAGIFDVAGTGGGSLVVDAGATFTHLSGTWSSTDITNRGILDNRGEIYAPNFDNRGTVFNRSGASLFSGSGTNIRTFANAGNVVMGDFTNAAGATLENTGTLSSSGVFDNQGGFTNSGTLTNAVGTMNAGNITGPGKIVNDGGEFTIAAGNSVTGAGSYTQLWGLTRVNGLLEASAIAIQDGILRGTGTVSGPVTLGTYAQILPGNSPGTLSIIGNLDVQGYRFWESTGPHLVIEIASPTSFGKLSVSGDTSFGGSGNRVNVLFDLLPGYVPDMDDQFQWLMVGGAVSGTGNLAPTVNGSAGWYPLVATNGAGLSVSFEAGSQIVAATYPYELNLRGGVLAIASGAVAYNRFGAPGSGVAYFYNFGSIDNYGKFYNRIGAVFSNEGALTNHAGAYLQNRGAMDNVITIDNHGTFVNRSDGTLTNNYGTVANKAGGQLLNEGLIQNQVDATITNEGLFKNSGAIRNEGAIANNGGTFEIMAGGVVSGAGTYSQIGGTTRVNGDLSASVIHFMAGALRGDGTLNGISISGPFPSVIIDAGVVVSPGNSVGTLSINGNVTFNGALEIEIADAANYDRLLVIGDAVFGGGSVSYLFLGGYTPSVGESIAWLSVMGVATGAVTLGHSFHAVNADGSWSDWDAPPGLVLKTSFDGSGFVFEVTPVPESETWAMLLIGLGLVGLKLRSKQRSAIQSRIGSLPGCEAAPTTSFRSPHHASQCV